MNGIQQERMNRRFRRISKWMAVDLIIVLLVYIGAYSMRAIYSPLDLAAHIHYILVATITTLVFVYLFGIYDRIWAQTSGHGITIILGATLSSLMVMVTAELVINPRPLPLSVVLLAHILIFGGLVSVRYRSRLISGLHWRWRVIWHSEIATSLAIEHVLIIGAGEAGQTLAWQLKHRFNGEASQYKIAGFIDDDPDKQGMYVENCPVLGNREAITQVATEEHIQLIVLAIHNITGQNFRDILSHCERTNARIKIMPDVLNLLTTNNHNQLLRDVQPEDLIGRSIITRHEAVDLSPVMGKVVLVTGGAGSIGSELSRQIASYDPIKLIVLDNNESALHDLVLDLQSTYPQLVLIPALIDITIMETLAGVFEAHSPQIVFHAAAYKHVPLLESHPKEAVRVNVVGTRQLAELAQKHRVERFVSISTDKAVNPSSVMGASKRLGELTLHALCQNKDCPTLFTAVRFGNVLGSRGSVVPIFTRQIEKGGPITVTHPEMTRYFMSISEAVNLVIHAACLTKGDDIFVLRMGEVVRILDIAERMVRLRGLRPYEDIDIQIVGVRPGEKMHEELHDPEENPVETIHPYIMRLSSWKTSGTTGTFFGKLDHLCHNGLNHDAEIVAELTELTTHRQRTI